MMLHLALYSNDSQFLSGFSRALSAHLDGPAGVVWQLHGRPLFQTRLYEGAEPPADLSLVDIRDDPARGMDFVRGLRKAQVSSEVMVVAPGPDWAMACYDADVMSYLPDPPDPRRAAELILRRFPRRTPPQDVKFPFRTTEGNKVFPAERIVYVEYSDHRLLIHTDMGKRVSTTTMRVSFGTAAAKLLEDARFVRTHASFLVNIMHIAQFGQYVLTMDTGATVPVSHARHAEVKRQFNEFFTSA